MKMLDLAVVESRWWERGNVSVRGLFDLIASIQKGNPDAYHYEMFNNAASFEEIVYRVAWKDHIRHLVIAAHGDENGIYGAEADENENNRISRAQIRRVLRGVSEGDLDGLYLGTCLTGNDDTVEFLMNGTSLNWIAGYSSTIGWLEGSAVDLYFWTTYYKTRNVGGEDQRIRRVAGRMNSMKNLCSNLGFDIFVRGDEANGGVQGLLSSD